jgi:hypothetical protein
LIEEGKALVRDLVDDPLAFAPPPDERLDDCPCPRCAA